MSLAIQLPPREDQVEFNLRVWERVLADPALARIEGRIETNRHGQVIVTPVQDVSHSSRQSSVLLLLHQLLGERVACICPIATADGIRAADVIWVSPARELQILRDDLLIEAPEICVEVLSRSNTRAEMEEKRALYFDAGASEVWFCREDGAMEFHGPDGPLPSSTLCPDFPEVIVP